MLIDITENEKLAMRLVVNFLVFTDSFPLRL